MRVVVALGGNALARRGEALTAERQEQRADAAAAAIAAVVRAGHAVVVTHGNGPQVGGLALQAEAHGDLVPLDVLGAESLGMVGYWLVRALRGHLPDRPVAGLLTLTEVERADPAFASPDKPIGPVYAASRTAELRARGWSVRPDGDGVRRVVPSPAPLSLLETDVIRVLVAAGTVVVCAGGGGVPVARTPDGRWSGVEAVVDKDAASAVLARALDADALLLLTDVDAVYADWPAARAPLRDPDDGALDRLPPSPGAMGPKLAAARAFARGGGWAAIGSLTAAVDVLDGRAGTRIRRRG